jgi:AraC family transcriptional regulator, ethanolamine operon transcriptional activator
MSLNGLDITGPYPVCASPGAIFQASFDDIDEQAAQLVGHEQSYQQLSPGRFHGRFTTAELGGDAWLFIEETNQSLAQRCHVPAGMVSFMFLLGPNQPVRLEQDDFGANDLALFPGSSHFCVRCPRDTVFCVITLEEERLGRTLGLIPGQSVPGAYRLQSPHLGFTVAALRSLVGTFLSMIAASDNARDDAVAQLHLKEALLSTLALAVSTGARSDRSLPGPLYGEARALIEANLSAIRVTDVCTALDVSRRTLEDVFRHQLGIGPARFIKALRLNQIRRELRSPTGQTRAVADIAADWGIWHPSHFAADYAALFGELPSLAKRRLTASQDAATTRLSPLSNMIPYLSDRLRA